jgi:acetylornithine deacetylase/succinyl-diaminopimelate desuccinylase-like protein
MRTHLVIWAALGFLGTVSPVLSQNHVVVGLKRNPQVENVVRGISAERIETSVRRLAAFGTRHTLSDTDQPDRGIGAARRWIEEQLQHISQASGGRLVVERDEFLQPPGGRIPRPTTIVNLVASLPGRSTAARDRILVVSGHYDSIPRPLSDAESDAPGANDDASGTAAVLELAHVLSQHEFDATIVFLAVAGEEQGLIGSTHWAEMARQEGRTIEAMLTNDIIGNTLGGNGVQDNHRVRVFSEGIPSNETERQARLRRSIGGENDGPSRQLARSIKAIGEFYLPSFEVTLVFRRDRYGRGGDHIPFNERGFAAVRLTEPNEDFTRQHQRVEIREGVAYGDVPDRVDFAYVAQVTRINAAVLATLALAPAPPSQARFRTASQSYDTALSWQQHSEPDVMSYRVLWRQTYQPFWTHAMDVGNTTNAMIPGLSKDDFFFAVQAVDRDGNASLPAFVGPPARE